MTLFADVTGAVLLGGESRRMGQDKARLVQDGQALATRQAALLGRCFEEVLLVGGTPPADAVGRSVRDPEGEQSSLRGIVAAVESSAAPWVLVAATDMPALSAELVLGLVALRSDDTDAVVPRTPRPQPLCALYRTAAVQPVARALWEAGDHAIRGVLDAVRVTWLEGDDLDRVDGRAALANVNTPEEWAAFQKDPS